MHATRPTGDLGLLSCPRQRPRSHDGGRRGRGNAHDTHSGRGIPQRAAVVAADHRELRRARRHHRTRRSQHVALPDPQRHVSRRQAEIVAHGATDSIRNVGAANPITVGGCCWARRSDRVVRARPDPHRRLPAAGAIRARGPHRAAAHAEPPGCAGRASGQPDPARAAVPPPVSADNPFADLIGGGAGRRRPVCRSDGRPGRGPSAIVGFDAGAIGFCAGRRAARLPDDFDPFAAPPAQSAAPPPALPADPFADLMPGGAPSIDQAFGLAASQAAGSDDALARFVGGMGQAGASPAAPAAGALSTDPLALFGGPAAPAQGIGPTQPDNLSALHAAYQPPPLRAQPPRPAEPPRPAAAPLPRRRRCCGPRPLRRRHRASGDASAVGQFCAGRRGRPADAAGANRRLHARRRHDAARRGRRHGAADGGARRRRARSCRRRSPSSGRRTTTRSSSRPTASRRWSSSCSRQCAVSSPVRRR